MSTKVPANHPFPKLAQTLAKLAEDADMVDPHEQASIDNYMKLTGNYPPAHLRADAQLTNESQRNNPPAGPHMKARPGEGDIPGAGWHVSEALGKAKDWAQSKIDSAGSWLKGEGLSHKYTGLNRGAEIGIGTAGVLGSVLLYNMLKKKQRTPEMA